MSRDKKPYDEASEVTAEDGQVMIDGPDGVAVSLTPEAAIDTSERLADKAAEAAGQRRMDEIARRPKRRRHAGKG